MSFRAKREILSEQAIEKIGFLATVEMTNTNFSTFYRENTKVREAHKKDYNPQAPFSGDEVFIIGAGRFGKRAVDVLSSRLNRPLWVVEKDEEALRHIAGPFVEYVLQEGAHFLAASFHLLHPSNIIVPAVPIHLACEWLRLLLKGNFVVSRVPVPGTIKPLLPHTWEGGEGSLLVSYADFRCPDDCPEPEERCTVTGKRRGTALYALLGRISLPGYRVHVLRSSQLGPGVGGYTVRDFQELVERVESGGEGKWLVATACKCHGMVSAVEVKRQGPAPPGFGRKGCNLRGYSI